MVSDDEGKGSGAVGTEESRDAMTCSEKKAVSRACKVREADLFMACPRWGGPRGADQGVRRMCTLRRSCWRCVRSTCPRLTVRE
eukprot:6707568-Heterocapsa_arctica.AAC.1